MAQEIFEGAYPRSKRELMMQKIPVDTFIEKYNIHNKDTVEALKEFPVLSYLLGSVSEEPLGSDARPSGIVRPYRIVTEGSAMFGLTNPEDAMRWKGIFNHILGAARHVHFLADKISHATPIQKQKLLALGYTPASLASLDPDLLRDHKLIDHAGRRQMDELGWHDIHDGAHPSTYSDKNTLALLEQNGADPYFLHHMKEEDHAYLFSRGKSGRLKDIQFAVLTYGDWTYAQKPMSLAERFRGLRASKRAEDATLDMLEALGSTFESDIKSVFGQEIIQKMLEHEPYIWEQKIKNAYAKSAGLSAREVFHT